MNIILLSGGSGKRLWPISNDIRSKQFIKILKKSNNEYESMVQRIYNQIVKVDKDSVVTIATSELQVPLIKNQLGQKVGISIEPCRRDTFPAIALATAYLKDIQNVKDNEVVVVCPVDPYVDEEYFKAIKKLSEVAETSDSNLVLMGIKPTYPSEKFGYIIPETADDVSRVLTFKEKPDKKTAEEYIRQNALWNGGVFAFKLNYLMKKAHELIEFSDYNDLFNKYDTLNKISFDYAVVEKERKISMVRFSGKWEDLGTWNSLTNALDEKVIGKGMLTKDCVNTNIVNELEIPILGVGLENLIIAASLDGILVSNKENADNIKKYVDQFNNEPKFIDKDWGSIKILNNDINSSTEMIVIESGKQLKYKFEEQSQYEKCIILSGKGKIRYKDKEININVGDVVNIEKDSLIEVTECVKLIRIKINKI